MTNIIDNSVWTPIQPLKPRKALITNAKCCYFYFTLSAPKGKFEFWWGWENRTRNRSHGKFKFWRGWENRTRNPAHDLVYKDEYFLQALLTQVLPLWSSIVDLIFSCIGFLIFMHSKCFRRKAAHILYDEGPNPTWHLLTELMQDNIYPLAITITCAVKLSATRYNIGC